MGDIKLPDNYPFKPPDVHFDTKIYHPNVNSEGHVCTPEITKDWSPAMKMVKVITLVRCRRSNSGATLNATTRDSSAQRCASCSRSGIFDPRLRQFQDLM